MLNDRTLCEELFHTPGGVSHTLSLLQMAIEKHGQFAASVFESGYGAATTRQPGPRPARQ